MLTAPRRMTRSPWMLAIGLIVGLPAIADAQLFPNMNVKRQRPSCAQEPPFNAHVRRDYFGYYPTCWSRFPAGWGCPCPNPELPDRSALVRDRSRSQPAGLEPNPSNGADAPLDDAAPAAPGDMPSDPNLPAMPPPRSPFDTDPAPAPAPGARPAQPDANRPGGVEPLPSPAPPAAAAAAAPGSGLLDLPKLPDPSPAAGAAPATSMNTVPGSLSFPPPEDAHVASTATVADPSAVTGLAMPDPRLGAEATTGMDLGNGAAPAAEPARAPARRSLIGGLFGNGNRRRR